MGLVSSLVDVLTGAWKEFREPSVKVTLEKLPPPGPEPPEVPAEVPVRVSTDPPERRSS
jgi:hypothetical protein